MILMKEFVSLTTVAMEIGKKQFFNDQWKMLQEEKILKTWILQMQTTTEKIELIRYSVLGEVKLCNHENVHFEKKSQKSFKKKL